MNYQNLQSEENENLSVEDEKIREMCRGLKRVEAPKDFDFHLAARMANHRPQAVKSPFLAFLRYAAPLGLAVIILGVIVSNNLFSIDNRAEPTIAGNFTQPSRSEIVLPVAVNSESTLIAKNSGPNAGFEIEPAKNENSNQTFSATLKNRDGLDKLFENSKNNRTNKTDGSGSRDSASTQSTVRVLQMFNANKTVGNSNGFNNPTRFLVKELLSDFGIDAVFSGTGWKVQKVRQNSIAERSGILPNDLIEAINEIRLSTETIQQNLINGTKIAVVREGKRIEIDLR